MPKKMLIDATHAEETRVVVVDGNKVEEFDFESENKRQLAGNIYLAKVTRVEPSLQAAFIDYGGNRHGFLAFSEIHPDYYQIPVADRQALLEEERAYAEAQAAREEEEDKPKRSSSRSRSRSRSSSKAADVTTQDATTSGDINGMETVDLTEDDEVEVSDDEASSPMERVSETPVETPAVDEDDQDDDGNSDTSDDDGDDNSGDASDKDDSIESVADEDDSEDIRPARKPRPKRYKIQEVIKVRQILLVQVVKEERGNKGAALTTYLSLAGRYCVLMPNTARGGGISRKITNAADRKKLKEIANEIKVPQGAGLIVRTAGAKRTKAEIKRDYEYLQRLWEQIRELTLKSMAPAKIYEEGDLIKRSIRDLYNRDIDEIHVEGERGYRIAKDFMKMIMPSHAKNVKRYEERLPLFARYQVETYLSGMFNPTVQLPSGGYIVIGVTEALVAIDVNSGRATKEGSIEQTALKTNLEAADEVARQLRLRDLAGLIVIDFIDMDERKNNASVEKRMKDKLKTDRARIQIGRISGFGLMEMSRQRLRPGMIEATTQPCQACHGTGLIRSDDNLALSIIRQIEEEGTRRRSREVLIKAPVAIANFLMNQKREHVAQCEARYGMSVRIEGDPHLISPEFSMEKFKTATRVVPPTNHVVSVDTSLMDKIDEDDAAAAEEADRAEEDAGEAAEERDGQSQASGSSSNGSSSNGSSSSGSSSEGEGKPKRRRRRRRSRSKSKSNGDYQGGDQSSDNAESGDDDQKSDDDAGKVAAKSASNEAAETAGEPAAEEAKAKDDPAAAETKKKPSTRSRSRSTSAKAKAEAAADADATSSAPAEAAEAADAEAAPKPKSKPKSTRSRSTSKAKSAPAAEETATDAPATDAPAKETTAKATAAKPKTTRSRAKPKPKADPKAEAPAASAEGAAKVEDTAPDPVVAEQAEDKPSAAPAKQAAAPSVTATPEPEAAKPEPAPEAAPEEVAEKKPKKRGWWSLGG
ncbi:ribonuclease [Sulfitobacter sp. EhC04]|uniref:Rne/Rng family ribonuclease n=1 Tax=Sulfitobacter sp. EhC04 TaxID=1849168 RepID=UPI0007F52FAC|nr:ribonuclease E/G [Sulfitobacter sp. EhC04]OAN74626.1 ribonuclease [Sulfitobacter sp. EhC04]